MFITGSGGNGLTKYLGAKFVQEVNAVSLAVEKLYPDCGSVIELGGQDAKIIIFKKDPETGRKKKIPSMNDKCAGGTGAVIDKINAKLRIPAEQLCEMGYKGLKLHPVAGKCGVFAETDINGLQKMGVPPDELMASLFEAIVMQNLSVLTRGNTLLPVVLLLGGPNCYIKGMRDCWKANIPKIWEERSTPLPEGVPPEDLIRTPDNAQYFAAIGCVEFGKTEDDDVGQYTGYEKLDWYVNVGREEEKQKRGGGTRACEGRSRTARVQGEVPHQEVHPDDVPAGRGGGRVRRHRRRLHFHQGRAALEGRQAAHPRQDLPAFQGQPDRGHDRGAAEAGPADSGSGRDAEDPGRRHHRLRQGHPEGRDRRGCRAGRDRGPHRGRPALLRRRGRDLRRRRAGHQDHHPEERPREGLQAEHAVLGGQRLLPAIHRAGLQRAGGAVRRHGVRGQRLPEFGYGCAVFMQSDIVDFQRQGWKPEEIMAGLCNVLPKNIWLYVSQIPNLSAIGTRFLLQGGTQYNLAAVKAQVDFIESRFKGKEHPADVIVHEHCGEAGAIGAALEAGRLWDNGRVSTFIGLDACANIQYKTTRDEATRCYFCKNKCLRTFIDVKTNQIPADYKRPAKTKVPLEAGAQRLIIATCEKGTVEDIEEMRGIKGNLDKVKKANPNFVEIAAKAVFRVPDAPLVADPLPKFQITAAQKKRAALMKKRAEIRIGMPRVLNMYSQTPVFTGYFASLGIKAENIVYSDYTSEELYKEGAKRGAIDPCFPSKLGIPHVHNLLYKVHAKKPLDIIFFPMIDCLTSPLSHVQASRSCPTVAATPEAVKAAFTKEGDLFEEKGVLFLDTFVNLSQAGLLERQMYEEFKDILGLVRKRTSAPWSRATARSNVFDNVTMRGAAREVLEQLEREDRLGVVLLGRPYHNDPGVNHEILEEFQKLGYPVFAQDCLPIDDDIIWRLFGDEVIAGETTHPHGDHGRVEEHLQREHQPQGLGRQVRGAASEPGGAGAFELQVRPRRADLLGGRGDRGALRHAVLLLQGHRREQADRLDQDPRRDHRLLPEALPRRHGPQQGQAAHDRTAVEGIRRPPAPADDAREAGEDLRVLRNRSDAPDPREPGRTAGIAARDAGFRAINRPGLGEEAGDRTHSSLAHGSVAEASRPEKRRVD